jgi:hypothetical protein
LEIQPPQKEKSPSPYTSNELLEAYLLKQIDILKYVNTLDLL